MSTQPQEDWRAEALRQMEMADEQAAVPTDRSGSLGIVLIKCGILLLLAIPMALFLGYSWLFSLVFIGWLLFSI